MNLYVFTFCRFYLSLYVFIYFGDRKISVVHFLTFSHDPLFSYHKIFLSLILRSALPLGDIFLIILLRNAPLMPLPGQMPASKLSFVPENTKRNQYRLLGFSPACPVAIVHGNHFLHFTTERHARF